MNDPGDAAIFVTSVDDGMVVRTSIPSVPCFSLPLVFVNPSGSGFYSFRELMMKFSSHGFMCYEVADLARFLPGFHKSVLVNTYSKGMPLARTIEMHQDIIVAYAIIYRRFSDDLDETPYRIEEELVKNNIRCPVYQISQDDELFRKIICMISDVLSGKIKEYILPEM